MNILLLDIDTLRPDHLGCYGYPRNTSPNIDAIARDGVVYTDYYCSDAPCLPSRAAMFTGRFGIHNGVVGHGGTPADMPPAGPGRGMQDRNATANLPAVLRRAGLYTASISSFPERHAAWWFHAGFNESIDPTGKRGLELAGEVIPTALDWLDRNQNRDWFLHLHVWDPHAPYRTPEEEGDPFKGQPLPQLAWMNEEVLAHQWAHEVGQHGPQEAAGYAPDPHPGCPRQLQQIRTMEDFTRNIDGYDTGVWYADRHIGMVVERLKQQGLYEDTAIIVTADHGEALGEGGAYVEHGMADHIVTHIPMVIKWPGMAQGAKSSGLHYNLDLLPTLIDLLGIEPAVARAAHITGHPMDPMYDGESYAGTLREGTDGGRGYLVTSQLCHICQRGVRFGDWMYLRNYHDGYHLLPDEELYDVVNDPGKLHNLAPEKPEVCWQAAHTLERWHAEQMRKNVYNSQTDPMWTVIAEGGPFHCKNHLAEYCERLDETGRGWAAKALRARHPQEL